MGSNMFAQSCHFAQTVSKTDPKKLFWSWRAWCSSDLIWRWMAWYWYHSKPWMGALWSAWLVYTCDWAAHTNIYSPRASYLAFSTWKRLPSQSTSQRALLTFSTVLRASLLMPLRSKTTRPKRTTFSTATSNYAFIAIKYVVGRWFGRIVFLRERVRACRWHIL